MLPKPGAVTLDFYDLAVVHQPIEGGGRNNGYINLGIRGQLFPFRPHNTKRIRTNRGHSIMERERHSGAWAFVEGIDP